MTLTKRNGEGGGAEQVLDNIINIVTKSIDVLVRGCGDAKYKEHFCALSVLQKAEKMPNTVVHRVMGVNKRDGEKIIRSFEDLSLVRTSRIGEGEDGKKVVWMHDLVLDASRELQKGLEGCGQLYQRWISSYKPNPQPIAETNRKCGGGSSLEREEKNLEDLFDVRFREWWLEVEDDGYMFKNIIRVLGEAGMREEMFWLMNRPAWIVKQLDANKFVQVREDFRICGDGIEAMEGWSAEEKGMRRNWLDVVESALTSGMKFMKAASWIPGMTYTQLYGRLEYYKGRAGFVDEFLDEIEVVAPKPWVRPQHALAPASGSMKEKFDFEGELICLKEVGEEILVCTQERSVGEECSEGGRVVCIETFSRVTQTACNERLLQVKSWVECGTFSESGNTVVLGLVDGRFLVCDRKQDIGEMFDENESAGSTEGKRKTKRSSGKIGGITSKRKLGTKVKRFIGSVGERIQQRRIQERETRGCLSSFGISGSELGMEDESARETVGDWTMEEGRWTAIVLSGHEDDVRSVAISGDGTRVVSGAADGTVLVWTKEEGRWTEAVLSGDKHDVTSVAISGDGTRVVSGSKDSTVRVWTMEEGRWTHVLLSDHENLVCSVAISGDGTRVMSGFDNGTVRVWTMEEGQWIEAVMSGHESCVSSVVISEDGIHICSRDFANRNLYWKVRASNDVVQMNGAAGIGVFPNDFNDDTEGRGEVREGYGEVSNLIRCISDDQDLEHFEAFS